jgi:hypothetical protein
LVGGNQTELSRLRDVARSSGWARRSARPSWPACPIATNGVWWRLRWHQRLQNTNKETSMYTAIGYESHRTRQDPETWTPIKRGRRDHGIGTPSIYSS